MGKLLKFDSCQRLGIERRNLEEQWFGIIRPIAQARIPPFGPAPTGPIDMWLDWCKIPLVDSLTS